MLISKNHNYYLFFLIFSLCILIILAIYFYVNCRENMNNDKQKNIHLINATKNSIENILSKKYKKIRNKFDYINFKSQILSIEDWNSLINYIKTN